MHVTEGGDESKSHVGCDKACMDPEMGTRYGHPLKNHKNIGFFSNTAVRITRKS